MAKTKTTSTNTARAQTDSRKVENQQKRRIADLKKQDHRLKWATGIACVAVLLLLLLLGVATDWTRGLKSATPITSSLDTLRSSDGTGTSGGGSSDTTGSASSTGSGGSNGTNGSNGANDTSGGGSTTTTNSSTTSNTSSTTNNSTTTPPPSNGLLSLFADSGVGDNIDNITSKSQILGVSKNCHTDILVQVCDFSDGSGNTMTVRDIVGTGVVTGITKNF